MMIRVYRFLLPAAFLLACAVPARADEVHLKIGSRLVGKILESTPAQVVIRVPGTGDVVVRRADVRREVRLADATAEAPTPPPVKATAKPAEQKPEEKKPEERKPEEKKPEGKKPAPAPVAAGTPVQAILQKLKDGPPDDQPALQQELIKHAREGAFAEMAGLLDRVEPGQTGWLVNAMAQAPGPDSLNVVLGLAKAEKPQTRAAAAALLGILGKHYEGDGPKSKEGKDAPVEGLDAVDENGHPLSLKTPPPEEAAVVADGKQEEAPKPQLREEIDDRARDAERGLAADPDGSVRAAAIAGLSSLYDVESLDVIVEAVADPDPEVRVQAIVALEFLSPRMPDPAPVPLRIVEILEKHEELDIKKAALSALSRLSGRVPMDDERIFNGVLAAITHEDKDIRAQALMTLGRVAPAKAVDLLTERLPAEPDPWARIQILNALIQAGNAKAVPAIIDRIENDPDRKVHDAAIRTIQAITKQHFGGNAAAWRAWWNNLHGVKAEGQETP